jgi:hypothetical protein
MLDEVAKSGKDLAHDRRILRRKDNDGFHAGNCSSGVPLSMQGYTSRMSVLLGRFLQLIGMIILPIGLLTGLLKDNVSMEVRLLFIGGAFFLIGWLIARRPAE